jgi:hypothetical protein
MYKHFLITISSFLIFLNINPVVAQENDYGTIQVLYIYRLNQQMFNALQNTDNWSQKMYNHTCTGPSDTQIADSLNRNCKKKIAYTLVKIKGYSPAADRSCTRFYEGSGKICDAKMYAEATKVYVQVEKINKSLSYMISDDKNYLIQYKEGTQNKLQFEIAVGEDYVIALFHEDEKIFWAGNMQNIKDNKSWKMFNPQGAYPYAQADEGYFKVKTRVTFD